MSQGRHVAVRRGQPYARRRATALVGALVVAAAVVVTILVTGGTSAGRLPRPTGPARFPGPDGVEARWVLDQNRLPGTTSWKVPHHVIQGAIEGFANKNYAVAGQDVSFYVSTAAKTYVVDAYRMGYYQGKGAHLAWVSGRLDGHVQPACPVVGGIAVNMVSCDNWTRSFTLRLPRNFVQGDYLFKLIAGPRVQAYVPLTVWDPTSHATYLLMNRTFVEEGWNTFGGYSFYLGQGPCPAGAPSYPVCNRARIVSFDRPYNTGNGAADFFGEEYPLVSFCEQHGLDVAYVTDVTVTQHPKIVAFHRVLLSLGHDESWSYQERVGVADAVHKGTNVVFFGAASVLRHVRMQASPLGADREEVDYRDSAADPLDGNGNPMQVTGNTWSSPPSSWPETSLVGEYYSGYLYPGDTASFVVADASSWAFAGTGLHNGASLPGVLASDIDHVIDGPPAPPNLTVLGHSPIPLSIIYTNQGEWGGFTYSDMTYFTFPHHGAGVIDTGDNNWINAMGGGTCPAHGGCPIGVLDRITGNILRLFGRGPAGMFEPSVSNLGAISPPGS